jgi:membrane glycosyltransferase
MEVRATLFARHGITRLGIAPLTSMYFTGKAGDRRVRDYRPEIHDSDGLLIANADGEWLWRPLANPTALALSAFTTAGPLGFGLLQRERDFARYQDLEAQYHLRPSLWVEPIGDWGPGEVMLMELPTNAEIHDNIVAFWVSRTSLVPGRPLELRYRLRALAGDGDPSPGGRAVATRVADVTLPGLQARGQSAPRDRRLRRRRARPSRSAPARRGDHQHRRREADRPAHRTGGGDRSLASDARPRAGASQDGGAARGAAPLRGHALRDLVLRAAPGGAVMRLPPQSVYAPRARRRRAAMAALFAVTMGGLTVLLLDILAADGFTWLDALIAILFAACVAPICLSFWTAMIGVALVVLRRDPVSLRRMRPPEAEAEDVPVRRRVAILMPICNEDPEEVFARLLATRESLRETGHAASFDFFVLSDTSRTDVRAREADVLRRVERRIGTGGRIFYRNRQRAHGRKAGNIAEWVRNWGGAYETMIILDADSTMSGSALLRLARMMERNPEVGILQTNPAIVGVETFFARAIRFASRVYGPVLATGSVFWQLGEANYFGHNAAIRVAAFAAHCGLPALAGRAPLGGEIMSHDFVEAACMRRGGWTVWSVPAIEGSYEEMPSNLIDYAARDRRWLQGNLQHLRLLRARGFHLLNRLHMLGGALAYLGSATWLALLALASIAAIVAALTPHAYFGPGPTLFPEWPIDRSQERMLLLGLTLVLLLAPKLLSLLASLASRATRRSFGGALRLVASGLAELVISTLLAPSLMMFHAGFIAAALAGRSVGWPSQARDERGTTWANAWDRQGWHVVTALGWAAALIIYAPDFAPWLAPVLVGLLLAVPASVITSRASRASCLFSTPEDLSRPDVLRRVDLELAWLRDVDGRDRIVDSARAEPATEAIGS